MGWAYLEFKDDCIGLGDTAAEDFNHEIRLIISELMDIFSKPMPDNSAFAMALGKALRNFTISAMVMGIVPDTPGVPFQGPIS